MSPEFPNSKLHTSTQFIDILSDEDINDHCTRITEWCETHSISAKFVGMWVVADESSNQYSLWEIDDPHHLTIFKLKWS